MTRRKPTATGGERSRKAAPCRSAARSSPPPARDVDLTRLRHELEVHKIELEMQNDELQAQNEELRRAKERADDLLAHYTELYDFAPTGYVSLREDGAILAVNFAAARLLGVERLPVTGQVLERFVASDDQARFRRVVATALAGAVDDKAEAELDLRAESGEPRRVRLQVVLMRDPGQRQLLLSLEDVTAYRKVEDELRVAGRRKDEFLAALSHELRNPLAPLRNALVLLQSDDPDGEHRRYALGVLDRQVDHLTRIVDDLLDVNRIAVGKIELRRERVDLHAVARASLDDYRAELEAAGVALVERLGHGELFVDADPTRLSQILGNLLGNAIKFTDRGGQVIVSLARRDGAAELRVADDGIGIAPAQLPRLFQPFAQAPQSIDRARGGLGLGLAMVKGMVELHGGSVAIASQGPGRGSQVTIRLPLVDAPRAMRAAASQPPRPTPRVLVIEDNKDAAESLKFVLEVGGHEVEVARDGRAGIERARAFHPEIVLCDLGLPIVDGYEVARTLRREAGTREAFLVALSGYARPEDVERTIAAGFDRHVAKPIRLERLRELVAEHREGRAPGQGSRSTR